MIRYGSIGVNDTGVLYNLDTGVSVCLVKYDMVIVTLCPTKECVGAFMADLAGRRSVLFPNIQREAGKDMRSSERILVCMRFWSGRLFLMFCSCFEVDND